MDSACAGTSQAGGLGGYRLVGGYGLRGCGLAGCGHFYFCDFPLKCTWLFLVLFCMCLFHNKTN